MPERVTVYAKVRNGLVYYAAADKDDMDAGAVLGLDGVEYVRADIYESERENRQALIRRMNEIERLLSRALDVGEGIEFDDTGENDE
jgi:hypothetical protein